LAEEGDTLHITREMMVWPICQCHLPDLSLCEEGVALLGGADIMSRCMSASDTRHAHHQQAALLCPEAHCSRGPMPLLLDWGSSCKQKAAALAGSDGLIRLLPLSSLLKEFLDKIGEGQ